MSERDRFWLLAGVVITGLLLRSLATESARTDVATALAFAVVLAGVVIYVRRH